MKEIFNQLTLKTKLIASFLALGILPACIVTWITWSNNVDNYTREASVKLSAFRDIKAVQIENLFKVTEGQIKTLSGNALTVDAMASFGEVFSKYEKESRSSNKAEAIEGSLRNYYVNQFGNEYQNSNGGSNAKGLTSNLSRLSSNAKALQHRYISDNPYPLGEKDKLVNPKNKDSSSWSSLHQRFHPSFREYLYEFGYYDIFLVDINNGNIVYSVYKELDFATSLVDGPFANTGIGEAFNLAANANAKDFVGITDMARYFPSYDAPAAFISSPIYQGDKKIGVLIFQIPVDKINAIMTSEQKWQATGFGATGESYLVGKDKIMRSMSRFLAEDEKGYFDLMQDKLSTEELAYIKAKKTTAIVQTVDTEGVKAAINAGTGFQIFNDYRDVSVLSAYKALNIAGLDWYLLAEMDEDEALASVHELRNLMLFILLISSAFIAAFSLFFSARLTDPINKLTKTIKQVEQNGDFSLRAQTNSNDEVGQISVAFNGLMESQQAAIKDVNSIMEGLAQGNIDKRVSVQLKGDLDTLKTATNSSLDSIQTTMSSLTQVINALSQGQFNQRMQGDFDGEFKLIKNNVNESMDGLEQAINEINRVMGQVEVNNLTDRVNIELKGDLDTLKKAVNLSVTVLGKTLTEIAENASRVATASTQTSSAIGQISDGAQNQLHAISQVATAAIQSGQAVSEVAKDTGKASGSANDAVRLANGGREKVAQMVDVVNVIAQNSKDINKITEVIGAIANQTNMLSLNAAIEAARAGEHGSGFAVVAEEVRKLAEHSANSSQEIAELVDQAVREAANAVSTAQELRGDIEAISSSSSEIDDMLRRVASNMEEQSAAMQEISGNVESIKRVAENSAAASEEITATVVEVSRQADGVRCQVDKFQISSPALHIASTAEADYPATAATFRAVN